MKIVRAERIALNIPFYADRVTRAMQRASTHDERVYVYRFISDRGVVGYGDCQGGRSEVANLVGRNPFEIMHDDSIGLGPQIAAFDLAGKIAGVPVHALLGSKQCLGGISICRGATGLLKRKNLLDAVIRVSR